MTFPLEPRHEETTILALGRNRLFLSRALACAAASSQATTLLASAAVLELCLLATLVYWAPRSPATLLSRTGHRAHLQHRSRVPAAALACRCCVRPPMLTCQHRVCSPAAPCVIAGMPAASPPHALTCSAVCFCFQPPPACYFSRDLLGRERTEGVGGRDKAEREKK